MDTSSRDPLLAMITENSNKWKMDALLALKDSPSCCGDHMEQETRLYKLYQSYQLYLFYQFYQMYRCTSYCHCKPLLPRANTSDQEIEHKNDGNIKNRSHNSYIATFNNKIVTG